MTKDRLRGFTLIELLVVIAIIGILSSIVLASLNTARAKARDAQRTTTIKQIQTALELYYNDNGFYPTSPDVAFPSSLVLTTALTPTYISAIAADPGAGSSYRYYTASLDPAPYYAIYIPYETKAACYMCGGTLCAADVGWWSVNICR